MPTKIEYAAETWNPVTGCTPVSVGCQNCYAKRMANRLRGRYGYPKDNPFKVTLHPDRLDRPFRWRKPRMIFVCSMGDLFHEDVPDEFIGKVFAFMIPAEQHTFLILTKRPERMKDFVLWFQHKTGILISSFRHLWLGVTAENQEQADKRIPILLQIPAAVRWVSIEPMLGAIDIRKWLPVLIPKTKIKLFSYRNNLIPTIDWVVCGGESGPGMNAMRPGARPMNPAWPRRIRDDCVKAEIPFFFKQWGTWLPEEYLGELVPEARIEKEVWLRRHFGRVPAWLGVGDHGCSYYDVGKKKTGRLLDGKIHSELPEVNSE